MSHVKLEEIVHTKFKIVKSGRTVGLRYNNSPFQLSTCKMYSPFGVNGKSTDYSPYTNWTIDCSINKSNMSTQSKTEDLFNKLDDTVKQLIKTNINSFPAAANDTDIETDDFYSPILRQNKSYPRLMKMSFPRDRNGNILSVLFDEDGKKLLLNDNNIEQLLCKGSVFKCILEFSKFWCFQNRIGSTWNVIQMRMCSKNTNNNDNGDNGDNVVNENNGNNGNNGNNSNNSNGTVLSNNLMMDD